MSAFRQRLSALLERSQQLRAAEPARFRAQLVLSLGLAAVLLYLVFGPKPFSEGIAKSLALGRDPRVQDYVVTYTWWAALLNAALLAATLAARRHWLRITPAIEHAKLAAPARRPSRTFALLLAAAVLAGSLLALPRLSHSLWTDEIFSVRRVIDGYWKRQDDGSLEFRGADWIDTFAYYRNPNNHFPFSVLSRASLSIWQRSHADGGIRFGEAALRFPAFVAGAGSIAAAGLFLWRAGFPAAGVLLAWLLALHPWHIRYASAARGYSLLLFLVSCHLALLLAVLHRGSWRRWIAYGLGQVLVLWTYPLVGPLVAVSNLTILAVLLQRGVGKPPGREQLARWVVTNLASVMVLVQLFAPLVPQILTYVGTQQKETGAVGFDYLRDVACLLYLGMPWRVTRLPDQPYAQLVDVATGTAPWPLLLGAALAVLALVAGSLRLWRRGGEHRGLVAVLLLPGPLVWLVAWLAEMFLWEWYLVFMLPCWGALLALGISWPLEGASGGRRGAALAAIVLLVGAFLVATAPVRDSLHRYSIQPRRESVALTRPSLDPLDPRQAGVLTASFHVAPELYDPNVILLQTPEELLTLAERADAEALPLFVNVGWVKGAEKRAPGMMDLVGREDLFERVAVLPGLKPRFTRHVYRYRGAAGSRK